MQLIYKCCVFNLPSQHGASPTTATAVTKTLTAHAFRKKTHSEKWDVFARGERRLAVEGTVGRDTCIILVIGLSQPIQALVGTQRAQHKPICLSHI